MGLFSRLFERRDLEPEVSLSFDPHALDAPELIITPREDDKPDPALMGMRVGIDYEDALGTATRRIIRIKHIAAYDDVFHIHAWCEYRQADRTFRCDRVATLYDPATGEVLPDPETYFAPYIERAAAEAEHAYETRFREKERSRFGAAWDVIMGIGDELRVLILVARADNRFVKAEKALLLKFAGVRAAEIGITVNDEALSVLNRWIALQDPAEADARLAITRLASQPGALDALWEVSELIAEADKKVRPEEEQAITDIRRIITAVAAGTA
ncbi:hypothetical protein BH10PSE7_BH10PSE7_15150 [soil metagenome]